MTSTPKICFIGGYGHHFVQQILTDPTIICNVAVASDGYDHAAARRFFDRLTENAGSRQLSIRWFDDGESALNEYKPDLLSVGAVYGFNGDWNAAGISRDISTVSDKPVAATWEQYRKLEQLLAEKPSRILLTEFSFRTQLEFVAAHELVSSGRIGDVVLVTAQKSYRFGTRPDWYRNRAWYPGTLMWVASHGIDATEFVTGESIVRLTGRQGNKSRPDMGSMEDHVTMLGALSDGGSFIVHADYLRPCNASSHSDDRVRVAGTKGIIEVRNGRVELLNESGKLSDVTDQTSVRIGIGRTLFDTAMGHLSQNFSSEQTMKTAKLLLIARDAVDKQQWIDVPAS